MQKAFNHFFTGVLVSISPLGKCLTISHFPFVLRIANCYANTSIANPFHKPWKTYQSRISLSESYRPFFFCKVLLKKFKKFANESTHSTNLYRQIATTIEISEQKITAAEFYRISISFIVTLNIEIFLHRNPLLLRKI